MCVVSTAVIRHARDTYTAEVEWLRSGVLRVKYIHHSKRIDQNGVYIYTFPHNSQLGIELKERDTHSSIFSFLFFRLLAWVRETCRSEENELTT